MIEKEAYDEFKRIYDHAIESCDTSNVPDKYMEAGYSARFDPAWDVLSKLEPNDRVLDFGCGMAWPTVLGRLIGLRMVAVDVPHYNYADERDFVAIKKAFKTDENSFELPYIEVLKHLMGLGHDIRLLDTNLFPWPGFAENEFDCVFAHWSMGKNFIDNGKTRDELNELYERRIAEMVRITKPDGVWYVSPMEDIRQIKRTKIFRNGCKIHIQLIKKR